MNFIEIASLEQKVSQLALGVNKTGKKKRHMQIQREKEFLFITKP